MEIQRLLEMQVLVEPSKHDGQAHGRLTTKFVRDWRKNVFVGEGDSRERWMRRSRLVAREYAVTKRDDTFSPATGAHTSNLLPLLYAERKAEAHGHENHQQQGHTRQTCCLYSTFMKNRASYTLEIVKIFFFHFFIVLVIILFIFFFSFMFSFIFFIILFFIFFYHFFIILFFIFFRFFFMFFIFFFIFFIFYHFSSFLLPVVQKFSEK